MTALAQQHWVPEHSRTHIEALAAATADRTVPASLAELDRLVAANRQIHDHDCLNLNPATNVMNPRAEAMLSAGLGSRASLGHPGDKYEMGLEAIEQIEVMAAELAGEVFGARYAEIRVPSGAIANLYAFLATCEPGDTIIAPPASIGGHVTHHAGGSAGMYRLRTLSAPVDADRFTVDVAALRDLALEHRPRMITIGASMNLYPHPVAALREVADEVGAVLLFDAAHVCGLIAGGAWPNPLEQGAHVMTMSTYKSLGGPPGGLVVTNERGDRPEPRRDRLSRPHRQLRRRQGGRPGGDDARLEGRGGRLRRDDGADGRGPRRRPAWSAGSRSSRASTGRPGPTSSPWRRASGAVARARHASCAGPTC